MPNTEVKLLHAESSWWETACEERELPREVRKRESDICLALFLYLFLKNTIKKLINR